MQVREIMSKPPASCASTDTAAEAARIMLEHDIGYLPVHEAGTIAGVVTDRDLVVRCIAGGKNPADTTIAEVMTRDVQSIRADAHIEEAAKTMRDNRVRRLLCTAADGSVAGVLSLGDLATRQPDLEQAGETMRSCCC